MTPLPEPDLKQLPPSDYQLMLPDSWFRISLDEEHRKRSVDALVNRQFRGIEDAPHLRQQLQQELLERAIDAFEEGGVELYISLQRAGALTIPASLLITTMSPRDPEAAMPSLPDLAARLGGTGRAASIVDLDAGPALRLRVDPEGTPAKPQADEDDYALPAVTVDYQLRIPRSNMHLLLTFSTPLIQIADAMVELFDAIAESLVWKEG